MYKMLRYSSWFYSLIFILKGHLYTDKCTVSCVLQWRKVTKYIQIFQFAIDTYSPLHFRGIYFFDIYLAAYELLCKVVFLIKWYALNIKQGLELMNIWTYWIFVGMFSFSLQNVPSSKFFLSFPPVQDVISNYFGFIMSCFVWRTVRKPNIFS